MKMSLLPVFKTWEPWPHYLFFWVLQHQMSYIMNYNFPHNERQRWLIPSFLLWVILLTDFFIQLSRPPCISTIFKIKTVTEKKTADFLLLLLLLHRFLLISIKNTNMFTLQGVKQRVWKVTHIHICVYFSGHSFTRNSSQSLHFKLYTLGERVSRLMFYER